MQNNRKPNGGFPPIYLCDRKKKDEMEKSQNREYITTKKAVSIKDIIMRKIKK